MLTLKYLLSRKILRDEIGKAQARSYLPGSTGLLDIERMHVETADGADGSGGEAAGHQLRVRDGCSRSISESTPGYSRSHILRMRLCTSSSGK